MANFEGASGKDRPEFFQDPDATPVMGYPIPDEYVRARRQPLGEWMTANYPGWGTDVATIGGSALTAVLIVKGIDSGAFSAAANSVSDFVNGGADLIKNGLRSLHTPPK